jgi:hypothetical protein
MIFVKRKPYALPGPKILIDAERFLAETSAASIGLDPFSADLRYLELIKPAAPARPINHIPGLHFHPLCSSPIVCGALLSESASHSAFVGTSASSCVAAHGWQTATSFGMNQ